MQLSFSFDLTNNFEVDDEVFLVHNIFEEMNLNFLDNAYLNKCRKTVVEPKTMIKVLVFAYLNRKYSARDIEDACKYDFRFSWLLDNKKAPDHDATFMRMKDDHMRNGQLKPGYNIQCAKNGNYIIGIGNFSNPADVGTLKPFMNNLLNKYEGKINILVADSGYESEENYVYLKENNIEYFIKPSKYDMKKKRKYKNDISRKENMEYCISEDYYICSNNKKLRFEKIVNRKNKYGFKSEIRVYLCEDCRTCEDSNKCIKYKNKSGLKRIYLSKRFDELRKESENNIVSEEGIMKRINRSNQAEGVFSYLLDLNRFLDHSNHQNHKKGDCYNYLNSYETAPF